MISITCGPVAGDLGIHFRAAFFSVLELFEHVDPCALADDNPGTIPRERSRCSLWLVIPVRSQHRHQIEACQNTRSERRINTAAEHYILTAQRDVLCCVSNRISRTGATS